MTSVDLTPAEQRDQLLQLNQWHLKGKIAIMQAGEKPVPLDMNWQQNDANFDLTFTRFIKTVLEVKQTEQAATLVDNEGKKYQADNAQQLIYDITSWRLPMKQMRQWIKGIPKNSQYELNQDGYVSQFTSILPQGTWDISITDYMQVQQYMLPKAITMTSQDIKLKVLVYEWHLVQ
ncbi:outer membrane lipoprotein LolB [Motilimonas pumila]|uniref:Outer-membrane lipoprotein LolB n=2 Tax=Motilimonas pumila TaxID=2303987 RepID=A0A418YJQ9_9GAMM|nr:outer membrane lipoprotein LolB [Motilimonas pumila]